MTCSTREGLVEPARELVRKMLTRFFDTVGFAQSPFPMSEPPRSVELDEDWFLYRRPKSEKWVIVYRALGVPQGPIFDSEEEALKFYREHETELKTKGMRHR